MYTCRNLRSWVKAFVDDPQQSFPGQGQMRPEQAEIARLKREVIKLKAERDRSFEAPAPNRKWIADFTYVWTAEGWLYVAAVVDLFSRRMVGWSMQTAMTAQLVTDALVMAIWRRGKPDALVHHSDRAANTPASNSSGCLHGMRGNPNRSIHPEKLEVCISSKMLLKAGSGARHIVRNASRKGSQISLTHLANFGRLRRCRMPERFCPPADHPR